MIEFYNNTRQLFESDLIHTAETPQYNDLIISWLSCPDGQNRACTSDWAQESLQYALAFAYRDHNTSNALQDGDIITDPYYYSRLHIVKLRLLAAGVRLARTLEYVLESKATTTTTTPTILIHLQQQQQHDSISNGVGDNNDNNDNDPPLWSFCIHCFLDIL
mmetsp:Transcript_12858/g.18518  ORF Transcript_12858/g.18518 Transcript_12858/m.18518 type:complete len:162 (+) Transcript_12858:681-1166(+)